MTNVPSAIRRPLALALAAGACALAVGGSAQAAPAGATARCRDGTYSFSQHRSGTCSYHGGVAVWLEGARAGSSNHSAGLAAPAAPVSNGRSVPLAPRTRAAGCRRDAEPDRRCSPGAYAQGLTARVICAAGFRTGSIRNVPQSEKFAVEREYGMAPGYYGRTIEIDHIVSLELGGSNNIANLFPEPGSGAASYQAKDRLENRLHDLVCAGGMRLRQAQAGIARDWVALYRRVFGAAPAA